MKLIQKTWFAWLLTAIMIAAAVGIGLAKKPASAGPVPDPAAGLDTSLSTQSYKKYTWDQTGILSAAAEQQIALYNANWDYRYNSVVAIVTANAMGGRDIEDFAWDQGVDMGLGEGDAILAVSVLDEDYFLAPGEDFATILTNRVVSDLQDVLSGPLNEKTILAFYEALNGVYLDNFGLGNAQSGTQNSVGMGGLVLSGQIISILIWIIVFLAILSLIDSSRYNAYRRQYYGVANPPVVFRPILFWHGPGSGWYRRRWRQPPPPPPPHSGGPRPGGTGGRSGGFGGAGKSGPRGGGTFGGRPSGGGARGGFGGSFGGSPSRGSSGRSGGFGGSSRSSGSRGSFGGSRSGGFSGSRGGGSRGGFGGRR